MMFTYVTHLSKPHLTAVLIADAFIDTLSQLDVCLRYISRLAMFTLVLLALLENGTTVALQSLCTSRHEVTHAVVTVRNGVVRSIGGQLAYQFLVVLGVVHCRVYNVDGGHKLDKPS